MYKKQQNWVLMMSRGRRVNDSPNGYLATTDLVVVSGSLCPCSLTADTRKSYVSPGSRSSTAQRVPGETACLTHGATMTATVGHNVVT